MKDEASVSKEEFDLIKQDSLNIATEIIVNLRSKFPDKYVYIYMQIISLELLTQVIGNVMYHKNCKFDDAFKVLEEAIRKQSHVVYKGIKEFKGEK